MPALPSSVIDPLWDQLAELLAQGVDTNPLGCHRPRIPHRPLAGAAGDIVLRPMQPAHDRYRRDGGSRCGLLERQGTA
jgi:hypothetical protein